MHNEPPPLDRAAALFLDIDGTLLEIAARPELVSVPPRLFGLLGRLAAERDGALVLVSGRRLADIDRLFAPWRGPAAGVHGAERRRADGSVAVAGDLSADRAAAIALERVRPAMHDFVACTPGVSLEDKGRSVALHYRAAPEHGDVVHEFAADLLRDAGGSLRLIAGKMVVELQPRHYGKGGAISAFLAEPPCAGRMPVFLGDDSTDEDGFAEVNRRGGVSIRVGRPAPTAARYILSSVTAALRWLAAG